MPISQQSHGIESLDDAPVIESVIDFSGGEDDYRRATLLDDNQSQRLVNIIVRDNYEAWTRPGANHIAAQIAGAPVRSLAYFDTPSSRYLLAICNGALYSCPGINQAWTVSTYTPSTSSIAVEMAQGIETMLISDGVGALATLDSALTLTTCSTGATDPPVGATILCWHSGRMFAAGFGGGTSGKERDAIWVSNRLTFGNGQWDGTSRSFRVGAGDGDPITALHSMQGNTMAVFKANSVWLVNTAPTAEATDFTAENLVDSVGFGVGCVGKRAVASVGNDVFFLAQDGIRSLQRMQAAAGQWQLSGPLSQPVQYYINRINPTYRHLSAAVSFKEFVMFAVPLDSSTTNNSVLVFNTRLGRWIGCWTGWTPAQFCKTRFNNIHQLTFGNSAGYVELWNDTGDSNAAATYLDNSTPIPCTIWTRAMQFGNPANTKTAYSLAMFFTAGNSSANVTAVFDLAAARSFTAAFPTSGDILGFATLGPFKLASVSPARLQRSLRALPRFTEAYLKVETTSGWFKLRSLHFSAFVDAMRG